MRAPARARGARARACSAALGHPDAAELPALEWDAVGDEVYLARARACAPSTATCWATPRPRTSPAWRGTSAGSPAPLQRREPELPVEAAPNFAATLLAEACSPRSPTTAGRSRPRPPSRSTPAAARRRSRPTTSSPSCTTPGRPPPRGASGRLSSGSLDSRAPHGRRIRVSPAGPGNPTRDLRATLRTKAPGRHPGPSHNSLDLRAAADYLRPGGPTPAPLTTVSRCGFRSSGVQHRLASGRTPPGSRNNCHSTSDHPLSLVGGE